MNTFAQLMNDITKPLVTVRFTGTGTARGVPIYAASCLCFIPRVYL